MSEIAFKSWPKTGRLFRDIVITEKIDGTNAAIHIREMTDGFNSCPDAYTLIVNGTRYAVAAQSRKRLITPQQDNHGFARWVYDNAEQLVKILGTGLHFGEWWGQGIQRGYGMTSRVFSLFNTAKWKGIGEKVGEHIITSVPVLYEGPFDVLEINKALKDLKYYGSYASFLYPDPEGICIYHKQANTIFKVTLDGDDAGKWEL
ncbi:RNA ligase family protein [Streptomyces sp. NPDC056638]|uniref:RNA ligase family protein n=1 Tax=Streptomyces sp. NPDC056638 TaxID=3345887 RepID=UPI0036B30D5B